MFCPLPRRLVPAISAKPQPIHDHEITPPRVRACEEVLREWRFLMPLPPDFGGREAIQEQSAGFEHAMNLGKRAFEVVDVLKDLIGGHHIERSVRKWDAAIAFDLENSWLARSM